MSDFEHWEYPEDTSLKDYLVLRKRRDELSRYIIDHIRDHPPEEDAAIAKERAELAEVLAQMKQMEDDAKEI